MDGILQKPWLRNMPPYDPDPQIIEKSLNELDFILNWVRQRGETVDNPVTVLVGGWAVDAYNPWYGSIDIDLVTNNRTKHSLMRILVKESEYDHFRIGTHTVYKPTDYGPIIIDFASREERYPFEGRDEELNFDILNGQTILKVIRNHISAAVPTRSLLMLLRSLIRYTAEQNLTLIYNSPSITQSEHTLERKIVAQQYQRQ